jgi:hypothetical protein
VVVVIIIIIIKNNKFSMWLNDNRCGSGNYDSNDYKTRNVVY